MKAENGTEYKLTPAALLLCGLWGASLLVALIGEAMQKSQGWSR